MTLEICNMGGVIFPPVIFVLIFITLEICNMGGVRTKRYYMGDVITTNLSKKTEVC